MKEPYKSILLELVEALRRRLGDSLVSVGRLRVGGEGGGEEG